jgi:prepilin-type N-terminal cleavage/methylation domain-containing protein
MGRRVSRRPIIPTSKFARVGQTLGPSRTSGDSQLQTPGGEAEVIKFRKMLDGNGDSEAGLSLIEVMVAMFIFAILCVGVAYSLVSVLKMTNDARGKQTATNLAAAEIDADRALDDIVHLGPHTTVKTVGGVAYTLSVTTGWVTAGTGAGGVCTTGTGALLAKQVNVSVIWAGMSTGATPVQTSTIVSPGTRLSDPDKGVIVVSAVDAVGDGTPSATITAVPAATPAGATAITATIDPTDAQGCGVILQVKPGNYIVSISKSGSTPYVSEKQLQNPTFPVTVSAGSSSAAPFSYAQSGVFTPIYHSNYTTPTGVTVLMPTAMDTTFESTNTIFTSTNSSFNLMPYTSGYTFLAGALAANLSATPSCKSIDPGQWTASADGLLVGKTPNTISSLSGQTAQPNIEMGVFRITGLASGTYIKATGQVTPPVGTADPGCTTPSTYVVKLTTASPATVALPFGSWKITSGTASTQTTAVAPTAILPQTLGTVVKVSGDSIVTLDPRKAP